MLKSLLLSSLTLATVISSAFVTTRCEARDDVYMLNLGEAMASAEADGRLDKTIKYYFGDSAHPGVLRAFGEYVANEKTNAFGKADLNVCNRVFLSALLRLQERARALGANAVVNIHSYYKAEDEPVSTQIPCHTGFLMSGVALKGNS